MERINIKSILSVLLGIISACLPILGYIVIAPIFAIMGILVYHKSIKEIGDSQQKGSRLAMLGCLISIMSLLWQVFVIFMLTSFSSTPQF